MAQWCQGKEYIITVKASDKGIRPFDTFRNDSMHVDNTLHIIRSITTLEIDLLVWVNFVPCLINREEESQFRGGIEKLNGFWCENLTKVGQRSLR